MIDTTLIKGMERLGVVAHAKLRESFRIIEEAFEGDHTGERSLNDISIQDERQLLEQTIEVATGHLAQLKKRLNILSPINKLPVELFIHILLLTKPSKIPYPYVSWTGVCRHWRTVIIQHPDFWTLVRRVPVPFLHKILSRSKSSELEVTIRNDPPEFLSALENHFTQESNRIRILRIDCKGLTENLVHLVLSIKNFLSLRVLILYNNLNPRDIFIPLLPVLVSLDHLETLDFTLDYTDNVPLNQVARIFGRLRNLSIRAIRHSHSANAVVDSLLPLLCDNTKLRTLRLNVHVSGNSEASQITLPELQFLSTNHISFLRYFRTPKLSCLDATLTQGSFIFPECVVLKDFNFSSIKCLYFVGHNEDLPFAGYSILGSKCRLHCESVPLVCDSILAQGIDLLGGSEIDSVMSGTFPHDHFRIQSNYEDNSTLQPTLSWLLPRLGGLTELYLFSYSEASYILCLAAILSRFPSVEKLVIEHENDLLEFIHLLNDTSLLPRVKYLCYSTTATLNNVENYAEAVGKSLAECLQSRQKASVHELKFIAFGGDCPPLSDPWMNELQELGTKVVIVEREMVYRTLGAYYWESI